MIKEVKQEVDRNRQDCKVKNKEKVEHLKSEYGDRIEKDRRVTLPQQLSKYGGVKVFAEGCDLLCEELKGPLVIQREGFPITLSDGEKALFTLGPKFVVYEKCNEEQFVTNVEISLLKYKWDKMSDVDKEPYYVAGRKKLSEGDQNSDPVQEQGPVENTQNSAKQNLQEKIQG